MGGAQRGPHLTAAQAVHEVAQPPSPPLPVWVPLVAPEYGQEVPPQPPTHVAPA